MKFKLLFVSFVLLSACAIVHYSYNGQGYGTASAMLAAQGQHEAELLQRLAPRATSLAVRCRVVIPDRETVQAKGAMVDGPVPKAALDALAASGYSDEYFKARVIERRHICEQTSIVTGNGHRVTPEGDEVLIYLHMPAVSIADWYVVRTGHEQLQVPFDIRILDDDQRLRDWLLRLEKKVVELSS